MKRFFTIPPTYFLLSLVIITTLFFVLKDYNKIPLPYNLVGVVFLFIGIFMNGQARDLFKKHKTSHQYEGPEKLIEEGIFKRTRNPMYLGMFIFIGGYAICFGNLVGFIVPFLFLFIIHVFFIPYEEKEMHNTFGKDYEIYKTRVKRWF